MPEREFSVVGAANEFVELEHKSSGPDVIQLKETKWEVPGVEMLRSHFSQVSGVLTVWNQDGGNKNWRTAHLVCLKPVTSALLPTRRELIYHQWNKAMGLILISPNFLDLTPALHQCKRWLWPNGLNGPIKMHTYHNSVTLTYSPLVASAYKRVTIYYCY